MRRAAILLLGLLSPIAASEPLTIELDQEVSKAAYVLEGRVAAQVAERSACRIEVTTDYRFIFRGFEAAGRTLELAWPPSGGDSFRAAVAVERRLLFVVDQDLRVVVTGIREGEGYRLQGYYDFNAVLIRIEGREAGFDEMQSPFVGDAWFSEKTGADRRRHARAIGRWLLAAPPGESDRARFEAALAALDSDSWEERERAEAELDGPLGVRHLSELESLAGISASAEVRRRLAQLLASLESWQVARELAADLAEPGPDRWRVLAACLDSPEADLAAAALDALRQETGRDLPADPAAWLDVLGSGR